MIVDSARLQALQRDATAILKTCREILAAKGTIPDATIATLQAATNELRGMTGAEVSVFSVAAVSQFVYTIQPEEYPSGNRFRLGSFSSGHKAAGWLGHDVLAWLTPKRKLTLKLKSLLSTMTTELGAQLQRERARMAAFTRPTDGPWSLPDCPSRWAKRLKIGSARTFTRYVKSGKIPVIKLSDRSYKVALSYLPADQK